MTISLWGTQAPGRLGAQRTRGEAAASAYSPAYRNIWKTVARIPRGRVATYGQIARLAGLGKRARLVGYALHRTPDDYEIPWHRVINAQGRISFPPGSVQYLRQRERLLAEAVRILTGRIDLDRFRWRPGADDLPPAYHLPYCESDQT